MVYERIFKKLEKENILKFIDILKIGPSLANVKNLSAQWEKYKDEFYRFEIY